MLGASARMITLSHYKMSLFSKGLGSKSLLPPLRNVAWSLWLTHSLSHNELAGSLQKFSGQNLGVPYLDLLFVYSG